MDLKEFINKYDFEGAVILLEGKRKVLPQDEDKLIAIAYKLAENCKNMRFRSGNAGGSDEQFAKGIAGIDPTRMEVVIPYSGHRKKANKNYDTYSLDDVNLAAEPNLLEYSSQHKNMKSQVKRYSEGIRDRFAIKAAYIIRDTMKVLGNEQIPKASAGLFYDDLLDPKSGGTGHTMRICEQENVAVFTQEIWMEWL